MLHLTTKIDDNLAFREPLAASAKSSIKVALGVMELCEAHQAHSFLRGNVRRK
jgi:hypothetical protein